MFSCRAKTPGSGEVEGVRALEEKILFREWEMCEAGITRYDGFLFQIRSWAVTAFSGVIALAVTKGRPEICFLAVLITLVFWICEGCAKIYQYIFICRVREIEMALRCSTASNAPELAMRFERDSFKWPEKPKELQWKLLWLRVYAQLKPFIPKWPEWLKLPERSKWRKRWSLLIWQFHWCATWPKWQLKQVCISIGHMFSGHSFLLYFLMIGAAGGLAFSAGTPREEWLFEKEVGPKQAGVSMIVQSAPQAVAQQPPANEVRKEVAVKGAASR